MVKKKNNNLCHVLKNSYYNEGTLKQIRDFSGGPLIGVLISMVTVPLVTRMVSPEEFGKSALFTLVQTLFTLVALFGLDQAFVRYYNNKEHSSKSILYNSFILPFLFCLIIIIFIVLFWKTLSLWIFEQNEPILMFSFCLFLPALLINRFSLLIVRMELRGILYSALLITSQIINFICLLLLLIFFEKSFRSIIAATVISTIINTCICLVFTNKNWTLSKEYFDKKLLKELLKFGIPLVPATAMFWLLDSFDKIGLKQWSNYEQLGLYAAAFKIVALLSVLQTVFTTAWVPIAYRWHENNENVVKFDFVGVIVLAIMTVGYAGIVVLRDFILLLLGPEYRDTSFIFIYLLFVPVMYTVSETTTLGIPFSKKTYFNLYISIICLVLSVTSNYLLIPKFGAIGAAISTALVYIAFFWARTLISRKLWYNFKINKYVINFVLLILLALSIQYNVGKIAEINLFFFIIVVNFLFVKKYYLNLNIIKN